MPRDRRVVEAGLLRKGFVKKEGDHHFFIYYTVGGKKTSVYTKTSHGEREIVDMNLSKMARQVKLTREDFYRLIDCSLSQKEYEAGLVRDEFIVLPPPATTPSKKQDS
jgi:hypothetical protein